MQNTEYKEHFYEMLAKGSIKFRNNEFIDKNNNKWTFFLDENLYLNVNLSKKDIHKRIEEIAQELNITYTIN